jgi:hypothetical protein
MQSTRTTQPRSVSTRSASKQTAAGPKPLLGEFVHTWALRILNLLVTLPFGLCFASFPWLDSKPDYDAWPVWSRILTSAVAGGIPLAIAVFVWWRGLVFRLRVFGDRIECRSVFGTRVVRLGAQARFFHKSERHFVNGVPVGTHVYLTFADANTSIRVNSNVKNVVDLQALALTLEQEHVLPPALERYRRGEPVAFGPLSLHKGRLTYRGKSEPLSNLDIEVNAGRFRARKSGKWLGLCSVALAEIPNFHTLTELRRTRGAAPADEPVGR